MVSETLNFSTSFPASLTVWNNCNFFIYENFLAFISYINYSFALKIADLIRKLFTSLLSKGAPVFS